MITKKQALKALDKLLTAAKTNDDNKFHHFDKFKRYNETIRTYIEQQDISKCALEPIDGLAEAIEAIEGDRQLEQWTENNICIVLEAARRELEKGR